MSKHIRKKSLKDNDRKKIVICQTKVTRSPGKNSFINQNRRVHQLNGIEGPSHVQPVLLRPRPLLSDKSQERGPLWNATDEDEITSHGQEATAQQVPPVYMQQSEQIPYYSVIRNVNGPPRQQHYMLSKEERLFLSLVVISF